MSVADQIIAAMERREAAQHLRRNEAEQGQCPSCGYRSDLDDFEVDDNSGDDADKEHWETQDGETTEDGGTTYDESNMNKPQLTPEQKLARALLESAQRNSTSPQHRQVNRPAQKPSAQRAQASQAPHAEENAALVLARAIAELRGERR